MALSGKVVVFCPPCEKQVKSKWKTTFATGENCRPPGNASSFAVRTLTASSDGLSLFASSGVQFVSPPSAGLGRLGLRRNRGRLLLLRRLRGSRGEIRDADGCGHKLKATVVACFLLFQGCLGCPSPDFPILTACIGHMMADSHLDVEIPVSVKKHPSGEEWALEC